MKRLLFLFFVLYSLSGFSQARYFARIEGDTVKMVLVVASDTLAQQLFGGIWIETFMNDSTKYYAGRGYIYHWDSHIFSPPKPYQSWTMHDDGKWYPPIPYPNDGKQYYWDENTQTWILINGTVTTTTQ